MHPEFNLYREKANQLIFYGFHTASITERHFHSPVEIYVVDDGEVKTWINGRQKTLSTGTIAISLSLEPHGYLPKEGTIARVLIIPTYLCKEFMEEIKDTHPLTPFLQDPALYNEIDRLLRGLERDIDNPVKKQGYLGMILGTILDHMTFVDRVDEAAVSLPSRVLFYLNEHYKQPLTLESVAAALGYNSSYLSRYFRLQFSISLTKYITFLRLREALRLMKEEKNSIAFCAMESGFPSLRTFYRCFSEEFHCSPLDYLKKSEK